MEQLILNILRGPDFGLVLQLLVAYVIILWVVFCVWVFADAYKRTRSYFISLLMAILVLILNFPALILYFVIRPEGSKEARAAIEMPITKFVDEKGNMQMAFNITLSPELKKSDFDIAVSWDDDSNNLVINAAKENKTSAEKSTKNADDAFADSIKKASKSASEKLSVFKSKKAK